MNASELWKKLRTRLWLHRRLASAAAVVFLLLLVILAVGYRRLSKDIDAKLAAGGLGEGTILYSAAMVVAPGDLITREILVRDLRLAGYSDSTSNPVGWYRLEGADIVIHPGNDSFFRNVPARIRFEGAKIAGIVAGPGDAPVDDYALEPQMLARIEDGELQRRRPIQFSEIPKSLLDALLSVEDKHFFNHIGFDPLRLMKAAIVNLRTGKRQQGGSTLTMQLARNLYLEPEKTWLRKIQELLIGETLELKLSKREILQAYVNQVYLGRRHTMGLHGFGQAAETYFGKDLRQITLPQAALLAGLVQRPSYFDPTRHPERAVARRNLVLSLMQQNGLISEADRAKGAASPIGIVPAVARSSDAPWFVELAADDLQSREDAPQKGRVYTTLDPVLQRDAVEAVQVGMKEVDARLKRTRDGAIPQVALVALDPHTGEVKALVGGRNFSDSQFNHGTALRQPGSAFKPFVYAAALTSGRGGHPMTPSTTVLDEPTTFVFEGQEYQPSNFGDHFYGKVTLRDALAKSMNAAAVSVAEQAGYRQVLNMAHEAGFNSNMRATPALALGAYEATPLEVAGAYTIFATGGSYVHPTFISEVRSGAGKLQYHAQPETHPALNPSVAFLMESMLTEVMRTGTGAAVRSKGFTVPAAGKTGTSRDGWFAGYISNLICVVWVGFDDNRDLNLEGAKSALPIWAEFMKRASRRGMYRQNLLPVPSGVVSAMIDGTSGMLAGPLCTNVRREYFLAGTQPREVCPHDDFEESFIEAVPASTSLVSAPKPD
ncbi:MAG: PBP1A family penicillin-binding protein [Bryobacteraceae bacterium]